MTAPKRQYPHLDAPVALVALWPDGSGVDVFPFMSGAAAEVYAVGLRQEYAGTEVHIVAQPELLAWVRAHGREV